MIPEPNPYERFLERYEGGRVPWGDPLPPPEIESLAAGLAPGRALDLGCGFGRVAIYLAQRGWLVDGIDFIPAAIEEARQRATAAGVAERARFHAASVDELDFLDPPYDLAVDIGCMHSFSEEMLRIYREELVRLLRHGGRYVLFAHLRDEETAANEEAPRGIPETSIITLLQTDFELETLERGVTQVEDRPPWNSAWFWYRRR
ncbi:MAG: class I SAM-dependent methyltransferase [Anaerolineales bacterium]|nr:class I SAM-dependent methyltransferase [Anaerolineales bacterium]